MNQMSLDALAQFLIIAKRNTYAAQQGMVAPSRLASHDLAYEQGPFSYLDSYVGSRDFSGQEVVYYQSIPRWSMNYYGRMIEDDLPPGFIETLREALCLVTAGAPYRGIPIHHRGRYTYRCTSEGDMEWFQGEESIELDGRCIYELRFHGGRVE